MLVARVTIPNRPNQYGEFQVRAYNASGERMPECDYFTNCKRDAQATGELMLAPWKREREQALALALSSVQV